MRSTHWHLNTEIPHIVLRDKKFRVDDVIPSWVNAHLRVFAADLCYTSKVYIKKQKAYIKKLKKNSDVKWNSHRITDVFHAETPKNADATSSFSTHCAYCCGAFCSHQRSYQRDTKVRRHEAWWCGGSHHCNQLPGSVPSAHMPKRPNRIVSKLHQAQDLTCHDMTWCDMIWYDTTCYDMIWYSLIWYDMIWYDMTWYDTIWYKMISHPPHYHYNRPRRYHPVIRKSLITY